jgi:predicted 3-demethylubiquinone-9 3-methyltransferase (glyoxalase superfamily)
MQFSSKIVPCLWFDHQGEDAAKFYTAVFPNSRITQVARYPDTGKEVHGQEAGKVLTVAFELGGQPFTALNGGPHFKFTEAISLQILCDDQAEVDRYWNALGEGGDPAAQQCGWLKDRFGLSWQVVPRQMLEYLMSNDTAGRERAFAAMLKMKKLDIAQLQSAFEGR